MKEQYPGFDAISFQLGMIEAFCEMVARGVKGLALSPALTPEEYRVVGGLSEEIAARYGIRSYLEEQFPVTDLAPPEETEGKLVILYYRQEEILRDYQQMAENLRQGERAGDPTAQKRAGKAFRRLLSYPE